MKIFDCHYHIDKNHSIYNISSEKKNIIFNSIEEYKSNYKIVNSGDSISILFDYKNNLEYVKREIDSNKINALKIHSRIQKITINEYRDLFNAFEKIERLDIPVIIDAFYYGSDYECQPNLLKIIDMIRLYPTTKFIIAHCGGMKVLEYFLHLKNLENVYFDLSFSLSYLRESSIFQDFKVLLKYGNPNKILFGTDYPYINSENQLKIFLEIVSEIGLTELSINNILYHNSNLLFCKSTI